MKEDTADLNRKFLEIIDTEIARRRKMGVPEDDKELQEILKIRASFLGMPER